MCLKVLGEEEARGDIIADSHSLKGGCSLVRVSLSTQAASNKTKDTALSCSSEGLSWGLGRISS